MGAIADFSFKKLSFFSSLLSVPCTKSYKPSSTAYLKELKRHVDDNFSVKCFILLQAMQKSHGPGADPGFFLGGGALVSCSTSTPVNHIVFFAEYQLYQSGGGGARTPCTLPLDPPLWPSHFLEWINLRPFRNTQTKTSDPSPYLYKTKITGSENNKLEVLLINRDPLRPK